MKIYALILTVGLLLARFATTAQAQTNLVANGSFEAGPVGEGVFTDWPEVNGADGNSNYGVTNSTTPPAVAEQGNYYAYFRGHPTDGTRNPAAGSQDCLGMPMTLKVGGIYNISFYLGTDGPLTNGASMWSQIGTDYGLNPANDFIVTAYFPNSPSALPYQKFSTNYVATSTYETLSFHAINATNGIVVTNGILLDNVSLVQTYPPLKMSFSKPSSLIFNWQFTNSPYRLQANGSLNPTNWVTLSNVPVNMGTNNQISLTGATNQQFYRLTLP